LADIENVFRALVPELRASFLAGAGDLVKHSIGFVVVTKGRLSTENVILEGRLVGPELQTRLGLRNDTLAIAHQHKNLTTLGR